jgi:DNA mismatch repair protein MutL
VFTAVQRAVRRAVVVGAPVAPVRGGRGEPGDEDFDIPWPVPAPRAHIEVPSLAVARPRHEQATFLDGDGERLPLLRVVGQLAQSYIVAEGPDGMYLIDQHAAHERVMYERFLARAGPAPSQHLLAPEVVPLSPPELAVVEGGREAFAGLGFDIEPFGPDSVVVRALPDVLARADVPAVVRAILDATADGADPIGTSLEDRLVRAVCKQATVKAGQTLSLEEMRSLVESLEGTESPRTCPHGRPTMIVMSAERLSREFGRS